MSQKDGQRNWQVGEDHPGKGLVDPVIVLIVASLAFLFVVSLVHGPFTPLDGPISSLVTDVAIGVFVLAPVAVVASFVDAHRARKRLETSGVRASSATVIHVTHHEAQGGEHESWDVNYTYDAAGIMGFGTRSFWRPPELEVGDPIPIVYDADHPKVHGWLIIS